jgi:hypothetical protein
LAAASLWSMSIGPLAAQSKSETAEKKKSETAALAKTASGPYTIVVDRARWDFGKGVGMAPSGLPMQMPMQTFEKSQMNTFGDHKQGGTPQAPTSTMTSGMSSGTGGGGGGGGGWGGTFTRPNLILDVKVQLTSKGDSPIFSAEKLGQSPGRRQLICVPKDKVRALDDQGRQLDSTTDPPSMRTVLPGVEYPQGDGRMALHLYVPLNPAARYIQSIDGDMLVAEASVRSAKFQGADLTKATTKRAGAGPVRLSKLQRSSEGIEAGIIAPPIGTSRPQSMNLMDRLREQRTRPQVTVELEDSNGGIHSPVSSSAEEQTNDESSSTQQLPGGGSSTTTTHQSGGMMSGSYSSSGSSGGGSFGMGSGGTNQPPKKGVQEGANLTGWKSPHESLPATNFRFDPLPDGIKVKSIRCTITEGVSAPKTVPFHLENIRLP